MDYIPYSIGYVTWRNPDGSLGRTRQIKKFKKNVKKEVLQSVFRSFAFDELHSLEENSLKCDNELFVDENIKFICDKMIELFRKNEIYNLKSENERRKIEEFLKFHPETIEVCYNNIDRRYFDITDDYVVTNIKDKAPFNIVWYFFKCLANNLEDQSIRYDETRLTEFIMNNVAKTDYYKNLTNTKQYTLMSIIDKYTKEDLSFTILMHWNDNEKIENYIAKKTLAFYKNNSNKTNI